MIVELDFNPVEVEIMPPSTAREVIQNVRMIITTLKRTVPMDRAFGIDGRILDLPIATAQARLSGEIIRAVNKYEPRAQITAIAYHGREEDGRLIGKVTVRIHD